MGSFSPFGCDPFNDPTCLDQPPPPVTIVIDTGVAAEVGSVAALAGAAAQAVSIIANVAGIILRAITSVLSLAALIWTTVLKPLLSALQKILKTIAHVIDKVLKPYLDWMRQMRKLILDLYNRFVRPIIVIIESIRRVIAIFKLLHIHVFDALDRQLAKIEGKILTPIYFALYRLNTLGNWVSFILNIQMLIHRGLFLGSMNATRGGTLNLLANAPIYGFAELPHVDTAPNGGLAPQSFTTATAAIAAAIPDMRVRFAGTPAEQLVDCWNQPLGNIEVSQATDDVINCVLSL